jgi:site-specific recombinase XerD
MNAYSEDLRRKIADAVEREMFKSEVARLFGVSLSYTCATLLLNSNVHPKYVQELLGHASISQTLDTYSHVLKGMDGGIGGATDEALG